MNQHQQMVRSLAKSPEAILGSLSPDRVDLIHAVFGISGEAGELLDAVKKHVIYEKPLDRENVIEELGDMEFYLEQMRQNLGITREETIEANISKLSKRYPAFEYTDQRAQERADKA